MSPGVAPTVPRIRSPCSRWRVASLRRHRLPLPIVLVDQPVDDVRDVPLDLLRGVGHDLQLELPLHARAIHEIEHPAQAQVVIEIPVPACFHLEEHFLDRAHPQREALGEVGAILRQLALDVVERGGVMREQGQAIVGDLQVAAGEHVADPERARHLEGEAALLVERMVDEVLQRLETARRPERGLAVLGAAGQPRADREDRRLRPEHALGRVADKRQHVVELGRTLEDVDLVDDDHDLLAPRANRLDEGALGFGERAVRRGHEQDEVGPRHELGRQALVLADDRVGARRVDDVEVLEEVDGRGDRADARAQDVGRGRGAVADEVNVRGRRRDALVEHATCRGGR